MEIIKQDESVNDRGDRLRPGLDAAKRRLESLNERTTGFIKDHTVACLLGALALGYLVARVARRQQS